MGLVGPSRISLAGLVPKRELQGNPKELIELLFKNGVDLGG